MYKESTGISPIKNGEKDGLGRMYNEQGQLILEIPQVEGKSHGVEKHYTNGKLDMEVSYINGIQQGLTKYYHSDGVQLLWKNMTRANLLELTKK